MLKIYGRRTSYNVQKIMWLVAELGVPHQRIDVGGKFGGLNTPEFQAMNPNGKIPVIDDDGVVVWESNAVVRYIAAKYGAGSWCPTDLGKRAQADQWMDWYLSTVNPCFMGLFVDYYKVPEEKRNWSLIKNHQDKCAEVYKLVDDRLAQQANLVGDQLTMGDIPVAATLYRFYTLGVELPKFKNIEAWYERLKVRPAYAEHVMVDYTELRGY